MASLQSVCADDECNASTNECQIKVNFGAHVKSRNIVWRQDARIESESGERRLGDPGKLFLRLLLHRVLRMAESS